MVAVCSALPLKSKNQMSLITYELMAFTQVLGHGEVQYYADNEPTSRQILRLLVAARSAIGLKTIVRTTKIYDSAGNSLVENAIQRIRSSAATLMEDLAGHTELRFSSQHPFWTWAAGTVHGCSTSSRLVHCGWRQGFLEQIITTSCKFAQGVSLMVSGLHCLLLGIATELWRTDSSFEEIGFYGGRSTKGASCGDCHRRPGRKRCDCLWSLMCWQVGGDL